MNRIVKAILFGLFIWFLPFIVSVLVWDMETNSPSVGTEWFYALMAFTGTVAIAISVCFYFRDVSKKQAVREGWTAGLIWYVTPVIMDLIVLVGLFKMSLTNASHLLVTYVGGLAVAVGVGYLLAKR